LIHCFDAYEQHEQSWKPRDEMLDTGLSGSFVFLAQRHSPSVRRVPLFSPCASGLVFRPGVTKIMCGNGGDAGGHCSSFCPSLRFLPLNEQAQAQQDYPGDGCGSGLSWAPEDVGPFLHRVNGFQKRQGRSFYNEFLIDPRHWIEHLPDIIEAYFIMDDVSEGELHGLSYARQAHHAFRQAYHLTSADVPLLMLHPGRWEPGPFSLLTEARKPKD